MKEPGRITRILERKINGEKKCMKIEGRIAVWIEFGRKDAKEEEVRISFILYQKVLITLM